MTSPAKVAADFVGTYKSDSANGQHAGGGWGLAIDQPSAALAEKAVAMPSGEDAGTAFPAIS